MPKINFNDSNKSFKCNGFSGENLVAEGPIIAIDHNGFVTLKKPDDITFVLQRDILPEKKEDKDTKTTTEAGELIFLSLLAHSRVWDNKNQSEAHWPTAEVIFDRQSGNSTIATHKIDLKRILIDEWSLYWNLNLNPTFQEKIRLRTFQLKMTSLAKNDSVELKLH